MELTDKEKKERKGGKHERESKHPITSQKICAT